MNAHSPRTLPDIPSHIEPGDVVDYDIYGDSRFRATGDLHEGLFKLAEEGRGIHWTPHNGGHWFINDHELLLQAARDPELFSNNTEAAGDGPMVMIPPMEDGGEPHFGPQSMNPPRHGVYRMPLMKVFAPNEIKRMEAGIRALATDLITLARPAGPRRVPQRGSRATAGHRLHENDGHAGVATRGVPRLDEQHDVDRQRQARLRVFQCQPGDG